MSDLIGTVTTNRRFRSVRSALPPLTPQIRTNCLPLSYAQERLWFIHRLQGSSTEYNLVGVIGMHCSLDGAALRRTIDTLVDRHESLRTHFAEIDGHGVQVIEPARHIEVPIEDLSSMTPVRQEEHIEAAVRRDGETPFDLTQGPLWRLRLLTLAPEEQLFIWAFHHIVCDGWSLGVFVRDLSTVYNAYRAELPNPLPRLQVQYADFAQWERRWLDRDAQREGLDYWKAQLAGTPNQLTLPTDRSRPALRTFNAGVCHVKIKRDVTSVLKELSRANGATLYMTLLAALGLLIGRYSGQDDIVLGTSTANRQDKSLEQLIGFFVNKLAIRMRIPAGVSFKGLLKQVRHTALEAYQYQDVPFQWLIEELAPARRSDATPIVQVSFVMQAASTMLPQHTTFELVRLSGGYHAVHTDLDVHVVERGGELEFSWLYDGALFDRWRVERMVEHFGHVLKTVATYPDQPVQCIELVDEEERKKLLVDWNNTRKHYPDEMCVHQLFERQAATGPDAIALVSGRETLTYETLNARANQLARYLRSACGVTLEQPVAIYLRRSAAMAVAVLATLKAGAAYVPLDSRCPQSRLNAVLDDAKANVILTESELIHLLPHDRTHALLVDKIQKSLGDYSTENLDLDNSLLSKMTAYLMYTSGSTGKPKGVVIEHRQVYNYLEALLERVAFPCYGRFAMLQSLAADASVTVLFSSLCGGGCLHMIPEHISADPVLLGELFEAQRIDCAKVTPSQLMALQTAPAPERLVPRHSLIVGGEPSDLDWLLEVQAFRPGCLIFNHYGPTETTVASCMYLLDGRPDGSASPTVPLGRPLSNTRAYVLDARLQLVPVGIAGELYLAGAGVGRGYLNLVGLTAARFVADPHSTCGGRMYRTGDMVRWRADGNLEFLGRADQQVKIRGFRVELGEVETVLRSDHRVQDAAVVADDTKSDKRLLAYVIPRALDSEQVDTHAELRLALHERMRQVLPDYMIPWSVMVLTSWPLTPNGKLDRRALPLPDSVSTAVWQAPGTLEEEILCNLLAEVLGVGRVGLDDDFFEMGGHSLMAMRLASRIRAILGVEPSIRMLFEARTVRRLHPRLRSASAGRQPLRRQERPHFLPLSYAQQRLWFIDQYEGTSAEYNSMRVLRLVGTLDILALERAIQTIVERHEVLRTHFVEHEGRPIQVIEPTRQISVALEDLRACEGRAQSEQVQMTLQRERLTPFDLARGPMLRATVLRLDDEQHIFVRTFHHIVSDGWSQNIFGCELAHLYEAYVTGQPNSLRPVAFQYADFALWEPNAIDKETYDAALAYWKSQLAGAKPLYLPMDRPRQSTQTFAALRHRTTVGAEQLATIKELSQENKVSLYMTLVAVFCVLLGRYSDQEDIVIGLPIAERHDQQLESLIGIFLNSLILRLQLSATLTFRQLLDDVRRTMLDAYQYQDIPFERIVQELAPERTINRTPIFQVSFALHNEPVTHPRLFGLEVETLFEQDTHVRYDLEVHAQEREGGLDCVWLYNRDLFDQWRIEQMARHYLELLESVVANFDQPLGCLDLVSDEERKCPNPTAARPVTQDA